MTARPIIYLASPSSPHVAQWVSMIGGSRKIRIYYVPNGLEPLVDREKTDLRAPLGKLSGALPAALGYFLLGVTLRFLIPSDTVVHAHNASGYGLAAYLSGRRYGLTSYGTEVFSIPSKGALYAWMLTRIVKSAVFVTCTSPAMHDALQAHTSCDPNRIVCFSLGVRTEFLATPPHVPLNRPRRWVVNRRITPHYDTVTLVRAFREFLATGGTGELVLMEGQSDAPYVERVTEEAAGVPEIRLVRGFFGPCRVGSILDAADFSISIPRSDQMSSSILESMARGTVPILRPLGAYSELTDTSIMLQEGDLHPALVKAFRDSAGMSDAEVSRLAGAGRARVEERFSESSARSIYEGLLARQE